MRIVVAENAQQNTWDGFAAGHPAATPYHGWAWLEAVRRAYGFSPVPLLALRDGQAVGLLPLVRLHLPGLPGRLISLPYCDCCGPLAEDDAVRQKLVDHALDVAHRQGETDLEIRQQTPEPSSAAKVLMRLTLPEGAERLMQSFPSKLRSQIKKPQRDGLQAVTGGVELLAPFYHIFSRNMRDLGSPNHSLGWFRAVLNGYGDRARVTVVFMPDGRPAAAAIWLIHGRRAFEPWASAIREYNKYNPNMLLYWSMLAQAADAGLTEFDMGRSTPGEGTHRFKRQWGARELGLSWQRFDATTRQRRQALPAGGSRSPRKFFAACWSRLPVGLANVAGPVLRRYISL